MQGEKGYTMQQVELHSLVSDLKADVSASTETDRKTVADRANMANLAALDMLAETIAEKNSDTYAQKAQSLKDISREMHEITDIVENLGRRRLSKN
jgi:exonuclease VII large subunit